jgi:hypothetical protein
MWTDPQHLLRSVRVKNFLLTLDDRDRDRERFLKNLTDLQDDIRFLNGLLRGYEANVHRISAEGKLDLFRIRIDLLTHLEKLFTVFDAISGYDAKLRAQDAERPSGRTNIRVGDLAWLMQGETAPILKLRMNNTLFSRALKEDGCTDFGLVIGEFTALNPKSDARFPEVIVRMTQNESARYRPAILSVAWAVQPPVNGISIYPYFVAYPHPLKVKMERANVDAALAYVFNYKKEEHAKMLSQTNIEQETSSQKGTSGSSRIHLPPMRRTVSSVSTTSTRRLRDVDGEQKSYDALPSVDAAMMRARSEMNKTFEYVLIGGTSAKISHLVSDSLTVLTIRNLATKRKVCGSRTATTWASKRETSNTIT